MSNIIGTYIPSRVLSRNDILRFFAARGLRADCEICGKNQWELYDEETGGTANLPLGQVMAGMLDNKVIPCVAILCSNCGNVRLHSRKIIEEWCLNQGNENA